MKPYTDHISAQPSLHAAPRRTRHLGNACLAYGVIVFASVAAAAAVVTETMPLTVGAL